MMELTEDDRQWLIDLDKKIWIRTRNRRGFWCVSPKGEEHWFERLLKQETAERVLRIIKECELPCVMDSGPYGGLSMAVYDHIVAPGQYPDCLIVLDQDHVINKAKTWDQCFEFLSQFTHNDRNRELADMYRLPKPEPKRRYEY